MVETIIMKGALEDHLGRIIYPDTEADQVMTQNGKTVEEWLADLLANFAKYLPIAGGTITGDVNTSGGKLFANGWGCFSASVNGTVMIAENAYLHPANNTYHFSKNHATMGARGIVFRGGTAGVWYFDTGNVATTENAEFTPTLISIHEKTAKLFTGDLNNVTENSIIDGTDLVNGPGSGWYYIQHITHSSNPTKWATQIAYAFNSTDVKRRTMRSGVWQEWEPFMTASNTPTQYYSTAAPTASDGKDGDVWDVYL